MSVFRDCVLPTTMVVSAFGQISQDHPELCGKPGVTVPLPAGISAFSANSQPVLHIGLVGSEARVPLEADVVEQVCPLAGSRLAVFGSLSGIAWDVAIVNTLDGRLVDEFWTYNPVMPPDQRWLVFRGFYSFMLSIPPTDEYLLYDLSKDAAGNRIPAGDHVWDSGKVIYPAVPRQVPFNNIGLPRHLLHTFRSDAFHWTSDSNSIIFADDLRGQVSIVWVRIGPDEKSEAYLHKVSVADVCAENSSPKEALLTLVTARVSASTNGTEEMVAGFEVLGNGCLQHDLVLHPGDFTLARTEIHSPERKQIPSVGINRGKSPK